MVYTGTRKPNFIILVAHTIIIFQNHLCQEYPVIQLVISVKFKAVGPCILIQITVLTLSPPIHCLVHNLFAHLLKAINIRHVQVFIRASDLHYI